MIDLVYQFRSVKIPTSKLNNLISTAYIKQPPKFPKNKIVKLYYIVQVDNTSNFICFVNKREFVNFSYKKWLENIIRKEF